jgi:iron complex outermembrane recepter protein
MGGVLMRKFLLLSSAAGVLMASPTFAQNAPAANSDNGLEVVIVTAQKRDQNLQSVPVSVTALSSQAIANQRIVEFSDLTRAVPSLTVTQTSSSPNNSIILRGIGTFAFSIGVEPSVAVIIDDMPVVQQAQAFDNLADLQRIEVLKGPQGTLFGKNASAGVIKISTKDPDVELTGSASITAASDGDTRLEGTLSAPINDDAGVRLTGFYRAFKGNVLNLTSGERLNDQTGYGVRGKFKGTFGKATVTVTAAASRTDQDGSGGSLRAILGTGTPRVLGNANLPFRPSLIGIAEGDGNFRTRADTPGTTRNETSSVAGKISYDLGSVDLISVTALQNWRYRLQNDVDGTDLNVLAAFTGGAANGGVAQSGPFESTNFTQELRLVSKGTGPLNYVVGAYYSKAQTDRSFTRGPVVLVANWSARNTSDSIAAFAQVDYVLPTKTTISGGARYNNEKIKVAFDNLVPTATLNTCAIGNPACRGSNSDDVVTYKVSVSQELAPQIMIYASTATGYKGFAYDIATGFNPARIDGRLNGTAAGLVGVGAVRPETSIANELGLKSRFWDNRLQLNIAGFSTDYKDFQAQSAILVGSPPAPQFVLNNVGKLRSKGVEVDFSARTADWLRFDGGITYTDAVMTSFPNAQGYNGQTGAVWNGTTSTLVGPCTFASAATALNQRTTCTFQDRSGANLPNSPKYKWTLGATANFALSSDIAATAVLSYQGQSAVNFDLLGNPLVEQKAYSVVNASFGVQWRKVRMTAFVNNLLDENYASNLTDAFGTFGGSATNDTHVINQFLTRESRRYGGIKLTLEL